MSEHVCPECGSPLENVSECRDYLNEMVKWDFEDFTGAGKVHHLTVLSYNLQHPSVYSPKGLEDAKESLVEFLKNPGSFHEHDKRNRERLGSDVRDWKIAGTPESHGEYSPTPVWTMRAADVVRGGLDAYIENVTKWAGSVRDSLMESGNLKDR